MPTLEWIGNDMRWLVVEYKGAHLYDTPDAQEKRALGDLWAARSRGLCLFCTPRADTLHTPLKRS